MDDGGPSPTKRGKLEEEERKFEVEGASRAEFNGPLTIPEKFLLLEEELCRALRPLLFSKPVTYIYNPLEYAWQPHSTYVKKYCTTTKILLFVGMNPGPFGMVQTGVPFGEVSYVRDWLEIEGPVGKPSPEHPQRRVTGFDCSRREVSGQRFWGLFKDVSKTPSNFFRSSFVHNYCPFVFMDEKGRNITPSDLKLEERRELESVCNENICQMVQLLQAQIVIGIGRYAYNKIKQALEKRNLSGVTVDFIMHPSPINPVANKGWNAIALKKLMELDVLKHLDAG